MTDTAIREPGVAGMFYPGTPDALARSVDEALAAVTVRHAAPKALIAPHAGYVYSGEVAASAYAQIAPVADRIERVVLLGPAHRHPVRGLAAHSAAAFRTPLGDVPLDRPTIDRVAQLPQVGVRDIAHESEHSLEVHLPFLQRVLGDFALVPLVVGAATPEEVDQVLDALWGGPETLIVISSDLSHFLGYDDARQTDLDASRKIERLDVESLGEDQACGRYPIRGLLRRARALDLRATTLDLRNSGDTQGRKDRVVGYGSYAFEYAASARLDDDLRETLREIARTAVADGARTGRPPEIGLDDLPRPLQAIRASFVTIKQGGELRGCIGSLVPHAPLACDVAQNAWKAAFADPRFRPVTAEEAAGLEISVSILSTARRIHASGDAGLLDRLRPDLDGLILVDGDRRGLFLPQVWEGLPDPKAFLAQLKAKAGLPDGRWPKTMQAYRFTTESF